MDRAALTRYMEALEGVEVDETTETTFFFYGSEHKFPFVTIKTTDDEHDRASNLDRAPDVFRLNIGLGKSTYHALFGGTAGHDPDFTACDRLIPHPVYGKMYWVAILNPSDNTFATMVRPLITEAYEIAAGRRPARTTNQ
jgi:hypothetical protein